MLNKVKIIGKILIKEFEKLNEKKVDDAAAVAPEAIPETDESPAEEPTEAKKPEPNGSLTILRCITQGEIATRINEEVQEEDVIEVRGYLRNEKDSRQILVRVTEFTKLDISFSKIDLENSNQVRLLGKVLSDLQPLEKEHNPEVLSFKLAVPREGVKSPLFFCRVNEKELVSEFCEKLQRNDVVLLEGFLQTQKIVREEEGEKKITRVSSIICSGFTLLDNVATVRKFMNKQGRIISRKYSQLTPKNHRRVAKIIKRLRQMALIPNEIIKELRRGFVVNYLLPRKEVRLANERSLAWLEQKQVQQAQADSLLEAEAQRIYDKISNLSFDFTLKKDEKGEPFGSVGFKEILTALEKVGFSDEAYFCFERMVKEGWDILSKNPAPINIEIEYEENEQNGRIYKRVTALYTDDNIFV
ncbi:16077_t:CDS:2 [Cetraspora pellucida]|uniref:16077_t:CDS:1 n=1 Tax=Cetraspora pellucida TaxID=1433469 RepID=A0ACA9L5T6_9GLOM|nr:16077_t:CDS:2 [Cetraspora pellucida]